MRLHAWFGPILPNRKQRYCGPEGPEIDGQTKMAKNSLYSMGVFTVTFNSRCPSVFGLLITFVIEMGMALEHAFWPFNCLLLLVQLYNLLPAVINNKRLSLEYIIIFCSTKERLS